MRVQISRQVTGPYRRGTAVALVAVSLVMLVSFASLAIDSGHIYLARTEMQRTVDSAALAGVSGLQVSNTVADQRAVEFAGYNTVFNTPVNPSEVNVQIGYWKGATRTFTPIAGDPIVAPHAVAVEGTRAEMPLFFAPVMGINSTTVRKDATAVSGSGMCAGMWGIDGITGDGSVRTDSYVSTDGPYGPGNVYANGDLCSCQDIVVNGVVQVYGDAMHGDGYDFTAYGTSYDVYGIITEHGCDLPPYEDEFPVVRVTNDNASIGLTTRGRDPFMGSPYDLYVTGNDSLTLNPGTYYFTSAMIDGQATITVTGPTKIYVDGPGTFTGGGIVNVTGNPHNLIIYSSGSDVTLTGGSNFYGAVVAPDSTVILTGGMQIYGTVLSRILDIDGETGLHVDETMVERLFSMKSYAPMLVD